METEELEIEEVEEVEEPEWELRAVRVDDWYVYNTRTGERGPILSYPEAWEATQTLNAGGDIPWGDELLWGPNPWG